MKIDKELEVKFKLFLEKEGMAYKQPYDESDLKKSYKKGSMDTMTEENKLRSKLLHEIFENLEKSMAFYPMGGSSVIPALTMTELNRVKERMLSQKEEEN